MKILYIVINPAYGWDFICPYGNKEDAIKYCAKEDGVDSWDEHNSEFVILEKPLY